MIWERALYRALLRMLRIMITALDKGFTLTGMPKLTYACEGELAPFLQITYDCEKVSFWTNEMECLRRKKANLCWYRLIFKLPNQ